MKIFNIVIFSLLMFIPAMSGELKNVSLQLQWKYQFQFAGFILAKEKGFYRDVGLNVKLKEWQNDINMVDEVINKKSQFAVARPSSLIDLSKGKEIIYLATIYQSSPLIFLAKKSSGIRTLSDFKNKRMMTTGDLNIDTSLLSMLYSQGIASNELIIQKPSFNVKDLIDNKTDLMASYISNEPFVLKELGGEPQIFSPKDYGFDFYNDLIITSNKYLKENPLIVKKFRTASLKGWEYAFSNIEETVDIILEKYNTQKKSRAALLYEARELKKLAYYKTDKIGKIETDKLVNIFNIYGVLGLIHKKINIDEVIYKESSLKFSISESEKKYLKYRGDIKLCIDPDWMPFEGFSTTGDYEGITADYFKLFERKLDKKFTVVKTNSWNDTLNYAKTRKCDVLSLAVQTADRKRYLNFTEPYITVPLVLATKLNAKYIGNIRNAKGLKLGIPNGYAFSKILKEKYPYLNIVNVKNLQDGLIKVINGEIDAYVGSLVNISYKTQTEFLGQLKISGHVDDKWDLSMGVRNDDKTLFSILEKTISSISEEEKNKIFDNWTSVEYVEDVDYTLVIFLTVVFLMIVSGHIYWNRRLKIANKKLKFAQRELQKLAVIDKLTNLYNRHKIDWALEKEKERFERYNVEFAVLMIDVDHFKKINDTYGHNTGDTVLKELASLLKSNSRKTDMVGRWGGEEFLIITPHVKKDSIEKYASILREKIEKHNFSVVNSVTVSIGLSCYKKEDSIKSFLTRVDKALYESKQKGRNRVTTL